MKIINKQKGKGLMKKEKDTLENSTVQDALKELDNLEDSLDNEDLKKLD